MPLLSSSAVKGSHAMLLPPIVKVVGKLDFTSWQNTWLRKDREVSGLLIHALWAGFYSSICRHFSSRESQDDQWSTGAVKLLDGRLRICQGVKSWLCLLHSTLLAIPGPGDVPTQKEARLE